MSGCWCQLRRTQEDQDCASIGFGLHMFWKIQSVRYNRQLFRSGAQTLVLQLGSKQILPDTLCQWEDLGQQHTPDEGTPVGIVHTCVRKKLSATYLTQDLDVLLCKKLLS